MVTVRAIAIVFVTLLANGALPLLGSAQDSFGSVDITPTVQELPIGGSIVFYVTGSSSSGGTVIINIPGGLKLLGSPTCSTGCRVPMVSEVSDETTIDFNLEGQIGTISFTVAASSAATIGTNFSILAYLVGGPSAVEQASATVVVVDMPPTQPVPTVGPTPVVSTVPASLDDNREAYLSVSPSTLRIAPNGEVVFLIQLVQWGMWQGSQPNYTIAVQIPPQLERKGDVACGHGIEATPESQCNHIEERTEGSGERVLEIQPGYASAGYPKSIILTLHAIPDAMIGVNMRLMVSASVQDESLRQQPSPVSGIIEVVETESLHSGGSDSSVGGVIELQSQFTVSGDDFSSSLFSPDVLFGLYDLTSDDSLAATASVDIGNVARAIDGSGRQVCHFPIRFDGVSAHHFYLVARGIEPGLSPCSACVLGIATPTQLANIVFVIE